MTTNLQADTITRTAAEDIISDALHTSTKDVRQISDEIERLQQALYEAQQERQLASHAWDRVMDRDLTNDELSQWVERLTGESPEVVHDAPILDEVTLTHVSYCPCAACAEGGAL